MKRRTCVLVLLYLVLFIFSVALTSVGGIIHQHLRSFDLEQGTCRLLSHEMVQCADGNWLSVYNGRVIDSVFAKKPTLGNWGEGYTLNQTLPCFCRPGKGSACDTYGPGVCYLNMNATRFIAQTQFLYKYGSDALISIGTLIFFALLISAAVLIYKSRNQPDDFVIMTPEKKFTIDD